MNSLINKSIVYENGITLCKPEIYALNVIKTEPGVTRLSVLNNGKEIIHFELDDTAVCEFVRKLQAVE